MTREEILARLKPLEWKKDRRNPDTQKAETILWYDMEIKREDNGFYTLYKVDIADRKVILEDRMRTDEEAKSIARNIYVNQALATFAEL